MLQLSTSDREQQDTGNCITYLSNRQLQVLALVAEGATDGEIALRLGLAVETVAWHVREIRAQLGARTRAHAVALALRGGLSLEAQFLDGNP